MTPATTFLLSGIAVICLTLYLYWRRWERQWARETLDEFAKAFPDRCPVCSFHNFGLLEGYVSGPVRAHDCVSPRPLVPPAP